MDIGGLRRAVAGITISAAILLSGGACGDGGSAAEPPAVAGDRVGPAGSACEFPASFQIAQKWQAAGFRAEPEVAELFRKGPLTLVCEIKAAPAGHIAFIRVWIGPGLREPRAGLDASLDGRGVLRPVWSEVELGGTPGTEVVYDSPTSESQRAFAVRTPEGVVVVMLDGVEAEEPAVVAGYELGKRTFVVSS